MSVSRKDRVAGVLVGLAAGDALGAGYEFGPAFDGPVAMKGGGPFNWEPGEWTDDTQMAICIAENLATGTIDLRAISERFVAWSHKCTDIGIQTSSVLRTAANGVNLTDVAARYHKRNPDHSAGNGSLMRTGPVALAFLGDNAAIAKAAADISGLTHGDPLASEACILWSIAIAEAVETGDIPDIRAGLAHIDADRRDIWEKIIARAETERPGTFNPNGFVVSAFQAAWSAITQAPVTQDRKADHLRFVLENAVRIGDDTDTVAAIAGGMLGAIYGTSAIPLEWKGVLHGWPGYTTRDLTRLAVLSETEGKGDGNGWPSNPDMRAHYESAFPQVPLAVPLPDDPGVLIGNVTGTALADTDVVVSLCRMGSEPITDEHVDVWLIDSASPDANPHLEFTIDDTVRYIAAQRDASKTVFLHCVRAESRTPAVAAAYLAHKLGISGAEALDRVETVLPKANPNPRFRDHVASLTQQTAS